MAIQRDEEKRQDAVEKILLVFAESELTIFDAKEILTRVRYEIEKSLVSLNAEK